MFFFPRHDLFFDFGFDNVGGHLYSLTINKKGKQMTAILATYSDFKTVEVEVDDWTIDAVVESFFETGAIMVSVGKKGA